VKSKFEGVITAMVTPLRGEQKKIDLEATDSLVDFLIEKGVNGLFILGTFGEGMLLAVDERRKLTERVINHVNKRVLVIVHVSHMEIERTEELIEHARDKGADAVALLPPFFYLVSEKALEDYFKQIFKKFKDVPFFIYNLPQLTGNNVTLPVLQNLVEDCPNFVGVKNSTSDFVSLESALTLKDKISLLVGCDYLDYPALLLGAKGIISGPSNGIPEPYIRLYRAFKNGDYEGARREQMALNSFFEKAEKTLEMREGEEFSFYKRVVGVRGVNAGGQMKEPLPHLDSTKDASLSTLIEEAFQTGFIQK